MSQTCLMRTKDLNEAAFIWSQPNSKLIRTEGVGSNGGNTVFFVFELQCTENELNKLLFDRYNGQALVEPNKFCEKQEQLRNILHGVFARRGKKTHPIDE